MRASLLLAIVGQCLALPESTQHILNSEVLDIVEPLFESPEHAAIGDAVKLIYPDGTKPGAELGYMVKNRKLSFGDVVALAGDFFADWQIGDCVPSISDHWDTSQDKSLSIAAKNVDILRNDPEGILDCILDTIYEQKKQVKRGVDFGGDVAQVYKRIGDDFDLAYTKCFLGYPILALCNPDHFGADAYRAYSSVHTLAMAQAVQAGRSGNIDDLKEAYFIEAYSQHFLTDLFASGHLRVPRRVLHSDQFDLHIMPGDKCTRAQHDEDGANGLWVTNREGQSWSVYGDKQYMQGRSVKNREMAHSAAQTSVDEIWASYKSGQISTDLAALRKTPVLVASNITQSVPLFEKIDNSHFLFRQAIDQRGEDAERKKYALKQDNSDWKMLLKEIEKAGPTINQYVFTKAFRSKQKIVHLARLAQSLAVTNAYGLVDAGSWGSNWGMTSQGMTKLSATNFKRTWTDFTYLGDDLYSLVGKQTSKEALHIGLKISQNDKGQLSSQVVWSENPRDGNGDTQPGEVLYGSFDQANGEKVMVKVFWETKANSKVELWKMFADSAPTKQSDVKSPVLNFLFPHKIQNDDTYTTLVGYAGGLLSTAQGTWFFCHWKNGYKDAVVHTVAEDTGRRPQAMLGDGRTGSIVRIFYGSRLPESGVIKIETFKPERKDDKITVGKPTVQRFIIDWPAYEEKDYKLWFFHDVNGNGLNDLVTYTSASNNMVLSVIVFPGQADGTYGKPIVSRIAISVEQGKLLTAEFMDTLYTAQSSYQYQGGETTDGAIMSLFDNYGILGSRILAPSNKVGGYTYMLAGQDGAIAGQRSWTVGWRPEKWMGSDRPPQAVGFAFV